MTAAPKVIGLWPVMHPAATAFTSIVQNFLRQATDLLFPPRCRLCRDGMSEGRVRFCDQCGPLLQAELQQPACPRCGALVAPFEVSNGRCAECREQTLHVDGTARVGAYYGGLGQLIRDYKFRGQEHLEDLLAAMLVEAVCRCVWFDRIEAITWVPTHWRRRIRRPVYPAETLATAVADMTGLPFVRLLRRIRAGPHQIGLSYTDRLSNVKGAFARRPGLTLSNARILLIDDVRTTGATLNECARVLRRAGAAEVYAGVLVTVGDVGPHSALLASI